MEELIKRLRELHPEEFGDAWDFAFACQRDMREAADAIEALQAALILMVLQYCTTDDGLLYHSFMSAGENAFAVLGVENWQQADQLWDSVLNQKHPKEE